MKKRTRITLLSAVLFLVLSAGAFFAYALTGQYKAEDIAVEVMTDSGVVQVDGNMTILPSASGGDTALIFYPGAKVEAISYLPLLNKLRQNGITCVLVKMPFNLAVLNSNAADSVIAKLPEVKNWYIGGHSLGGAMASSYASNHQDKIAGLVLLGAYVYGDIPKDKTLTIYGSNDSVLNTAKIDYTENVHIIDGGNHAQFGNYGAQKGDGAATITSGQQQEYTEDVILSFMGR